jgi:secreted PhoX family phosphatase
VAALASLAPVSGPVFARNVWAGDAPALDFEEVPHGNTETHAIPEGYRAQTLIRWGDPVEAGAPAFDPLKQTAATQAKQWGYNNDFVGWMPLPAGSDSAGRGLLCVNFEYTETHLMFPGLQPGDKVSKDGTGGRHLEDLRAFLAERAPPAASTRCQGGPPRRSGSCRR